jgi:hypothetical protein
MDGAAGEAKGAALRVAFDPRLKLEFHGSKVTSDAGLLAFRELDDALGLTELAGEALADTRTGQTSRHTLIAQVRHPSQSSRVSLILEIRHEFAIDDEALPLVLGLLDQVYALRRQLGRLCDAVAAQPPNVQAAIKRMLPPSGGKDGPPD